MNEQIPRSAWFVSVAGGVLDFVRDGEWLLAVPVPPGRHLAADFVDMLPPGAEIEVGKGLAVMLPPSSYHRMSYGAGSHESGANPDFKPTSASRMEQEMRLTLAKMQSATKRLEARERAVASVERIPHKPQDIDVIEPQPMEPKLEAAPK